MIYFLNEDVTQASVCGNVPYITLHGNRIFVSDPLKNIFEFLILAFLSAK